MTTPTNAAAPATGVRGPSGPVVVANGLDNPRQLSLANGFLYVAEAGRGGARCFGDGPDAFCVGLTGGVSAIRSPRTARHARAVRVASGFISAGTRDGLAFLGGAGVSVRGHSRYSVIGKPEPTEPVPDVPGVNQLGKLLRTPVGGTRVTTVADISALERTNPDGGTTPDGKPDLNSNPYGVLALRGRVLVADAGGNTIIEVRKRKGRTVSRVWAVLPAHEGTRGGKKEQIQAVPTSLAQGPDGSIYVGELHGEAPDTARVYRFSPTGKPRDFARDGRWRSWITGFTGITGVAVDRNRNVYVSQLFKESGPNQPPGVLTRVTASGKRTARAVPLPAGVAADRHGNVYVSAWSLADRDGVVLEPGTPKTPGGQIWRLRF